MVKRPQAINPTERDIASLEFIAEARFVITSQIKELFFESNSDLQVTRRRLRRLEQLGLISYIEPTRNGKGASERIHYLLKAGADFLRENGTNIKVILYRPGKNLNFPFLKHSLFCTDGMVVFKKALGDGRHPHIKIADYITEWEQKSDAHRYSRMEKMRMFYSFNLPAYSKELIVYPDATVVLASKSNEKDRIVLFVEFDRSTERIAIVHQKCVAYNLFIEKSYHKQFGVTPDQIRILFICLTEKRVESIRQSLFGFENIKNVRLTHKALLTPDNLINAPIWTDIENRKMRLLA